MSNAQPRTTRPLSWEQATELVNTLRAHGGVIVFTNGVFDLLHPGHVRYLEDARALGDALIVGLNGEESVRRNKGPVRPITSQDERGEILLALASVDAVVVFDQDTPAEIITALQPDVLVKGADWAADRIVGRETVEARNGRVVRLPLEEGQSTTSLVERVRRSGVTADP